MLKIYILIFISMFFVFLSCNNFNTRIHILECISHVTYDGNREFSVIWANCNTGISWQHIGYGKFSGFTDELTISGTRTVTVPSDYGNMIRVIVRSGSFALYDSVFDINKK